MSTYSRTRKSICRTTHLEEWFISRTSFRKNKINTFKEDYKRLRKRMLEFSNEMGRPIMFRDSYGEMRKLPCKYSDAKKLFVIWHLPL